jgi:hypothetical protein
MFLISMVINHHLQSSSLLSNFVPPRRNFSLAAAVLPFPAALQRRADAAYAAVFPLAQQARRSLHLHGYPRMGCICTGTLVWAAFARVPSYGLHLHGYPRMGCICTGTLVWAAFARVPSFGLHLHGYPRLGCICTGTLVWAAFARVPSFGQMHSTALRRNVIVCGKFFITQAARSQQERGSGAHDAQQRAATHAMLRALATALQPRHIGRRDR